MVAETLSGLLLNYNKNIRPNYTGKPFEHFSPFRVTHVQYIGNAFLRSLRTFYYSDDSDNTQLTGLLSALDRYHCQRYRESCKQT